MDLYEILLTHNRAWSSLEIFCFSCLFFVLVLIMSYLLWKKRISSTQVVATLFAVLFLGIVFASTVFTRQPSAERTYCLQLFWSWEKAFLQNSKITLQEIFLNSILLLPLGCLLPFVFGRKMRWFQAFLCGLLVSAGIEVCQLVFRRGLFEWDDMIHNAFGCMLGVLFVQAVQEIRKKVKRKVQSLNTF